MKLRLFILFILGLSISSCHVGRFFFWNVANTDDYKKFENASIKKGDQTFHFHQSNKAVILPDSISNRDRTKMSFKEGLKDSKTVAFIVIKNDSILHETYDEGYDANTIHTSFSMAKFYVSALIGIAIDEGYITSVDDPIIKYLPGVNDQAFEGITIKHLLDMQSGLKFNEGYFNPFGEVAKYYYGRNINKYLGQLKKENDPGEIWKYKSIDPQLLSILLESATQKTLAAYLEEKIWKKLGMESDASWSLDSKKHQVAKGFCCLNAIALDYAKFGRLYLNNGIWDGQEIISPEWIEESISFTENKNNLRYSYQWWHVLKVATDMDHLPEFYREVPMEGASDKKALLYPSPAYYAAGILGQYIYINPENNTIIIRLGHQKKEINWTQLFDEIARLN